MKHESRVISVSHIYFDLYLSFSVTLSLFLSVILVLSLSLSLSFQRDRLDSTDSRVLDGDLLDDVLTAPSNLPRISKQRSHTPANDDEVGDV